MPNLFWIGASLAKFALSGTAILDGQTLLPNALSKYVESYHPKLSGGRAQIEAAKAKQKEKRGAFDPVFTLDSSALRYNSSSNRGKTYATQMNEGVVEVATRSGIKFYAGSRLNLEDVKSPNSSTGSLGEYFVGLKVPLLRGRGLNEKAVAEKQAGLGIRIAEQDLGILRLNTLDDAVSAYWRWVAAYQKLKVATQILDTAVQRAKNLQIRIDKGDLAPVERTEADQEVRRREGDKIRAERSLAQYAFKLSLYLWNADGTPREFTQVAPDQIDTPAEMANPDIKEWLAKSIQNRPELKGLELARQGVALSQALARNDRKPSLDLVFSPGYDFGNDAIGATTKAGIFYSIPLRQNTVDGRIEEADQKLRKIALDRTYVGQQIETEVRDAANSVQAAYLRYQTVTEELKLAKEMERLERIRYEAGDGTLFLLIQRERATAEVQSRLIDSQADYQLAMTNLRAAAGDL